MFAPHFFFLGGGRCIRSSAAELYQSVDMEKEGRKKTVQIIISRCVMRAMSGTVGGSWQNDDA